MQLESLQGINFRNLSEFRCEFSEGLNVFQGENGQGKTNLLEAVYFLGATKSFRPHRTGDLIQHGRTAFSLTGSISARNRRHTLHTAWSKEDGREYQQDGKRSNPLDYIGLFHTVAFSREHMRIVRGSPEDRRHFIDRGVVGIRPAYIRTLVDYRRAVRQKNSFLTGLKKGSRAGIGSDILIELESWNEPLIDLGARILQERAAYVTTVRHRLSDLHAELFGRDPGEVEIRLKSAIGDESEIAGEPLSSLRQRLREALDRSKNRECERLTSLVGPHRDEILFLLDGRPVRQFGSSGQQRSILLAAILAKMEVFREEHGEYPVFLLDDFESELDRKRRQGFLRYCHDRFQILVAVSADELDMGSPWEKQKQFRVIQGKITPAHTS